MKLRNVVENDLNKYETVEG